MLNLKIAMPSYFQPKDVLRPFSLRMPDTLKRDLAEIAQLWTDVEEQLGGEKVSLNDVILRLLRVGVDGVWNALGGRPQTKADRVALVRQMADDHRATQKQ